MNSSHSARFYYLLLATLSGACGTGYEVLYNRALTSALGHTFSVNAAILVSFLSGIAIGSLLAHKFLRYLWLVETGLGLYTIVFFALLSTTGSYGGANFLYLFSISHSSALAGAGLLTFAPAVLVGMAVPMFASYIKEFLRERPFQIVYIIYNLGAIGGVLCVEFFLLRVMPISRTAFLMGGINLLIGFAIFILARKNRPSEAAVEWKKTFSPRLLLSLFILSVSSSIFQLFFLKTVYYTTGRFNYNFALALATVFFYLASGTWLIQKKPSLSQWVFPAAAVSIAFWFLAQPAMLFLVAILNSMIVKLSLPSITAWILAPLLLGFPLLFFGASVPACMQSSEAVSRDSGILLLVSGLGNVLGYLLFTLVLHPNLPIQGVLAVGVIVAVFSFLFLPGIQVKQRAAFSSIALLFLFCGFFTWSQALYFLSMEGYRSVSVLEKKRRLTVQVEEFPSNDQTFALRHYYSFKENQVRQKYFIDGYVSLDLPSEEGVAGSVAAMYANGRKDLLVLGFGTGMSAGAASVFFEHVDMVELNPEVIRLQDRFADINFNVHRLPKTRIFQGDGFQYLVKNQKKYDMIINSVTAPFFPASSKLYTEEFYKLVVDHLNPGGILSTWFDVRLHPEAVSILLKTVNGHFPFCGMNYIYDAYYILACSDRPLRAKMDIFDQGDISLEEYEKVLGGGLKERLRERALIPNVLEPRFMEALGVTGKTPVNRIDWPHLEYYHPEKAVRSHFSFMKRLLPLIDFGYSFVDGRPMSKEEFALRCESLEDWFQDAQPECKKQFHSAENANF